MAVIFPVLQSGTGDEIVGFVTRGRGVSIHRTDCINIMQLPDFDRQRLIEAEWQQGAADEENGVMANIWQSFAFSETTVPVCW